MDKYRLRQTYRLDWRITVSWQSSLNLAGFQLNYGIFSETLSIYPSMGLLICGAVYNFPILIDRSSSALA